MAANEASLLKGIVEVDETYVGRKPRKENRREDDPPGGAAPRGRATTKAVVIGAVENLKVAPPRILTPLSQQGFSKGRDWGRGVFPALPQEISIVAN